MIDGFIVARPRAYACTHICMLLYGFKCLTLTLTGSSLGAPPLEAWWVLMQEKDFSVVVLSS